MGLTCHTDRPQLTSILREVLVYLTYELDLVSSNVFFEIMVLFLACLLLHSANLGRQENMRPLFHIPLKREHHFKENNT